MSMNVRPLTQPGISRRTAVQAGAAGLAGLGFGDLAALRAAGLSGEPVSATARSCIYIFLSGGLSQHESFDLKPHAPEDVRGEFRPIATRTPGIEICEHLPGLAQRSDRWSLIRSLSHPSDDHTSGHYFMLTGRSVPSPGFRGDRQPRSGDWPSMASVVGDAVPVRNSQLPPAIVLPERLVHWSGGTIPGAFGGQMGHSRDPFFVEASPFGDPMWRGAYPEYTFPNLTRTPPAHPDQRIYQAPDITLSPGLSLGRLHGRTDLLADLDRQRRALEQSAQAEQYAVQRQSAVSLLASPEVRRAFDVTRADEETQQRYGRNSFGWSLLMAFRLVESGVNMVQVNLGNNETWDMHGDIFPRMKDRLLPPTDRSVCALLDDLHDSGLLERTLVVIASEFGRTPKLSAHRSFYHVGRDHWGAVQSVLIAGGGVCGGRVIGASDKLGAYPADQPQTPENLAATIYHALGIPATAAWHDELNRPHQIYAGQPIVGLF